MYNLNPFQLNYYHNESPIYVYSDYLGHHYFYRILPFILLFIVDYGVSSMCLNVSNFNGLAQNIEFGV